MKAEFLHKNTESQDLIVFFSGFASEPSHFRHLDSAKNVLMIYNYYDFGLDFSLQDELSKYDNCTLLAWSMGVCVASSICKNLKFSKKIAINGTNYGIHKVYGIPSALFKVTIRNLNIDDFKNALFETESSHTFRQLQELKDELESLYRFCIESSADSTNSDSSQILESNLTPESSANLTWDCALVSLKDRIFPACACEAFFSLDSTRIILSKQPHFVFNGFCSWEELCLI